MTAQNGSADAVWSSGDATKGLLFVLLAALLPLILFVLQFSVLTGLAVLGVALMAGFASFAVGGFFGLLFGLPRALSVEADASATQSTATEEGYGGNTNLQKVSDWLTAALVGVGLTQLNSLGKASLDLAGFLEAGFGGRPSSAAVALVTVLYFLIFGFVFGYLMARIRLGHAFWRADRRARETRAKLTETIRSLPAPPENGPAGPDDTPAVQLDESQKGQLEKLRGEAERLAGRGVLLDASDYRRFARQLKSAGRFEDAIEAYERAFQANPSDPAPLNFAGAIASRNLQRFDQAVELYRRALAIDPGYTSAIYNMACNEARRDRKDQALLLLTAAITSNDGTKFGTLALKDARPGGAFASLSDDDRFQALLR